MTFGASPRQASEPCWQELLGIPKSGKNGAYALGPALYLILSVAIEDIRRRQRGSPSTQLALDELLSVPDVERLVGRRDTYAKNLRNWIPTNVPGNDSPDALLTREPGTPGQSGSLGTLLLSDACRFSVSPELQQEGRNSSSQEAAAVLVNLWLFRGAEAAPPRKFVGSGTVAPVVSTEDRRTLVNRAQSLAALMQDDVCNALYGSPDVGRYTWSARGVVHTEAFLSRQEWTGLSIPLSDIESTIEQSAAAVDPDAEHDAHALVDEYARRGLYGIEFTNGPTYQLRGLYVDGRKRSVRAAFSVVPFVDALQSYSAMVRDEITDAVLQRLEQRQQVDSQRIIHSLRFRKQHLASLEHFLNINRRTCIGGISCVTFAPTTSRGEHQILYGARALRGLSDNSSSMQCLPRCFHSPTAPKHAESDVDLVQSVARELLEEVLGWKQFEQPPAALDPDILEARARIMDLIDAERIRVRLVNFGIALTTSNYAFGVGIYIDERCRDEIPWGPGLSSQGWQWTPNWETVGERFLGLPLKGLRLDDMLHPPDSEHRPQRWADSTMPVLVDSLRIIGELSDGRYRTPEWLDVRKPPRGSSGIGTLTKPACRNEHRSSLLQYADRLLSCCLFCQPCETVGDVLRRLPTTHQHEIQSKINLID